MAAQEIGMIDLSNSLPHTFGICFCGHDLTVHNERLERNRSLRYILNIHVMKAGARAKIDVMGSFNYLREASCSQVWYQFIDDADAIFTV